MRATVQAKRRALEGAYWANRDPVLLAHWFRFRRMCPSSSSSSSPTSTATSSFLRSRLLGLVPFLERTSYRLRPSSSRFSPCASSRASPSEIGTAPSSSINFPILLFFPTAVPFTTVVLISIEVFVRRGMPVQSTSVHITLSIPLCLNLLFHFHFLDFLVKPFLKVRW